MLYLHLHKINILKNLLLTLLITLFSSSLFARDEKPGRFFENQWPKKYNHKKFKKIKKKSYWCTYKLAEFAEPNWFREWK